MNIYGSVILVIYFLENNDKAVFWIAYQSIP